MIPIAGSGRPDDRRAPAPRDRPGTSPEHARSEASVDLYWLPLGAGGHSVRLNGRAFEAVEALRARRPRADLYHSALAVRVPEGRFVIEMTPIPPGHDGVARGVVGEGAVGSRWAARFRIFRYELRCWRDGSIPDAGEAVGSPQRVSEDPVLARRLLDATASLPTPVWGRDELRLGEMWNSNSVTSWLLERSGAATGSIRPPAGGRAPGWDAGLAAARVLTVVASPGRLRRAAGSPHAF